MLDPVEDREEYLGELRTVLELSKSAQDAGRTRSVLCALISAGALRGWAWLTAGAADPTPAEVLGLRRLEVPDPPPGFLRLRVAAAAVVLVPGWFAIRAVARRTEQVSNSGWATTSWARAAIPTRPFSSTLIIM